MAAEALVATRAEVNAATPVAADAAADVAIPARCLRFSGSCTPTACCAFGNIATATDAASDIGATGIAASAPVANRAIAKAIGPARAAMIRHAQAT
jgi:hypothetical protein